MTAFAKALSRATGIDADYYYAHNARPRPLGLGGFVWGGRAGRVIGGKRDPLDNVSWPSEFPRFGDEARSSRERRRVRRGPGSIVSSILGDSGSLGRWPASVQQSTWLRHVR
jgi:hypothetical protein